MPAHRPTLPDRLEGWRRRLRAMIRRRDADRDAAAELAFHLEMETEKNMRAGMDPVAARRAARLAFGGADRFTEELRDTRNIAWLEDLAHDVRHATRAFRRSPGFTVAAVAALTLGIGANTAVFSVVHAVVLAPLPYAEPERLVRLWEANPSQGIERGRVSPGTFVALRARSRELSRLALFADRTFLLSSGDATWESKAAAVSPSLFDVLGVRPVVGRLFPRDDGPEPFAGSLKEIVIGYGLWQQRFGGSPDVVGRTVTMDGRWHYAIIGVAPPGFGFPDDAEVWIPLTYGPTVAKVERQFRYYDAIAQLAPGRTLEQAMREAAAISTQLETEFPASNAGWTVALAPLRDSIVGRTRPTLLVVFALAGCVLLVACGNVATLAVARATARSHETAVRIALGAGRHRLLRQWVTEGVVLATVGGACGTMVAVVATRALVRLAPVGIPRLDEVAFSPTVVAFALLATLAAAMIVGLAPALRARDTSVLRAMRGRGQVAGTASVRTREWLIAAQVALTLVLTVAASLLVRSFDHLQRTELGYRRADILSAELRVAAGRFESPRPWYERIVYYDRLMRELAAIPGVRSVAGIADIPLTGDPGSGSLWRIDAPGASGTRPPTSAADQWKATLQIVTTGYFRTMGIPVVRGRDFTDLDRFTERELTDPDVPRPVGVAIINQAMARRYWPGEDPLGRQIVLFNDLTFAASRTIVGIVHDVRARSVDSAAAPAVFLPFAQNSGRSLSIVMGTGLPPRDLVPAVTARVRAFDPAIAIGAVQPLEAVVARSLSQPRFTMRLVGSFALIALVIAAVGVFGVVGFLVARRTQEIGVRMALGAHGAAVVRLVLRDGLRPVVGGIILGAIAAAAVVRGMRALLYGMAPFDLVSFGTAVALIVAASVAAAALPARRAAAIDPLRALRNE